MLGTKGGRLPERSSEGRDSEPDSSSVFSPKAHGMAVSYEYSGSDKASDIRTSLNWCMLSLLLLLLLLSIITYTVILSMKYLIVATHHYEEIQNCLHSEMHFDGWNYMVECVTCHEGFHLEEGRICLHE